MTQRRKNRTSRETQQVRPLPRMDDPLWSYRIPGNDDAFAVIDAVVAAWDAGEEVEITE